MPFKAPFIKNGQYFFFYSYQYSVFFFSSRKCCLHCVLWMLWPLRCASWRRLSDICRSSPLEHPAWYVHTSLSSVWQLLKLTQAADSHSWCLKIHRSIPSSIHPSRLTIWWVFLFCDRTRPGPQLKTRRSLPLSQALMILWLQPLRLPISPPFTPTHPVWLAGDQSNATQCGAFMDH